MPNPTHVDLIQVAIGRITESDGFLIISIKNQDVSVVASVSQSQDHLIAGGIAEFIEQRDQAIRALEQANESIH